jgi:hypothetical protein
MSSLVEVTGLAFQVVAWIVMAIGFVVALATARKHPRRSTLAAIGLAMEIGLGLAWRFLMPALYEGSYDSNGLLLTFNVVAGVLDVIAWALIVTALLVGERAGRAEAYAQAPGQWAGPQPGWPPPGPPPGGRP